MKPEELLFAETHEWVHVSQEEGNQIATVGISAFAVEQLTDLVYLELTDPGTALSSGDEFGEVESVKAVSSLYSPVTGEIVEVNTGLADQLETLNDNPYDGGWMIKVKINDDQSLSGLMDHASYLKQCAGEN
ncbi:MAG TPA: glycine cleavage system protein GcvH [Planctomycetes bacterium]|nr:glycine cleavage system protein GcvH [Planctomycetaceae bacterium]HIN94123.1 glycine cleavage system protein GcvH [Planctomycetota bacterium]